VANIDLYLKNRAPKMDPGIQNLGTGLGSGTQIGSESANRKLDENARRAERLGETTQESDSFLGSALNFGMDLFDKSGLDSALEFVDRGRKTINLMAQDNLIASMFANPFMTAPLLLGAAIKGEGFQADKNAGYEITAGDYWDILMGNDENVAARMDAAGAADALLGFNRDISYSSLIEANTGFTQEWVNGLPAGLKQAAATARFALAFTGDVVNDPTTYLTGGMGGLGRGAAQGVVKSAVRSSAKTVIERVGGKAVKGVDDALRVLADDAARAAAEKSYVALTPLERRAAEKVISEADELVKATPSMLWDDAVERVSGIQRDVTLRASDADNKVIQLVDGDFLVDKDGIFGRLNDNLAGHIETKNFDSIDPDWQAWVQTATKPKDIWTTGGIRAGMGQASYAIPGLTPATRGLQRRITKKLVTETRPFKAIQKTSSFRWSKNVWDKSRRMASKDAQFSMAANPVSNTSYTAFVNSAVEAPTLAIKAIGIEALGEVAEIGGRWTGLKHKIKGAVGDNAVSDATIAKIEKDLGSGVVPESLLLLPKEVREQVLRYQVDVDSVYRRAADALAMVDDEFSASLAANQSFRPVSFNENFAIVMGDVEENVRLNLDRLKTPADFEKYAKKLSKLVDEDIDAGELAMFMQVSDSFRNDVARLNPTGETAEFRWRKIGRTGMHIEGSADVVDASDAVKNMNDSLAKVLDAVVAEQNFDSKALRRMKKQGGSVMELDPAKQLERYVADVTEAIRQRVMVGEAERFALAADKGKLLDTNTFLSLMARKNAEGTSLWERIGISERALDESLTKEQLLYEITVSNTTRVQIGTLNGYMDVPNGLMSQPQFAEILVRLQDAWDEAARTAQQFPHQYNKQRDLIIADYERMGIPPNDATIHAATVHRVLTALDKQTADYLAEVEGTILKSARERAGLVEMVTDDISEQSDAWRAYLSNEVAAADRMIGQYRDEYQRIFTDEIQKGSISSVEMSEISAVLNDITASGERFSENSLDAASQAAQRAQERLTKGVKDGLEEADLRDLRHAAEVELTYADALSYKLKGVDAPAHGVAHVILPDFIKNAGPDASPSVLRAIEGVEGAIPGVDELVEVKPMKGKVHPSGDVKAVRLSDRAVTLDSADNNLFFFSPAMVDSGSEAFRLLTYRVSGTHLSQGVVPRAEVMEWWNANMVPIAPNVFVPLNGKKGIVVSTGVPANAADQSNYVNAIQSELRRTFYGGGSGKGTSLVVESPRAVHNSARMTTIRDIQVERIAADREIAAMLPDLTAADRKAVILEWNSAKLQERVIGDQLITPMDFDAYLELRKTDPGAAEDMLRSSQLDIHTRDANKNRLSPRQGATAPMVDDQNLAAYGVAWDEDSRTYQWVGEESDVDVYRRLSEGEGGRKFSLHETLNMYSPVLTIEPANLAAYDAAFPTRLSELSPGGAFEDVYSKTSGFEGKTDELISGHAAPEAEAALARRMELGYERPAADLDTAAVIPVNEVKVQGLLDLRDKARADYEMRIPLNQRRITVAVQKEKAAGGTGREFMRSDQYKELITKVVPFEQTDEFKDWARKIRLANAEQENANIVAIREAGGGNAVYETNPELKQVAEASSSGIAERNTDFLDDIGFQLRKTLTDDGLHENDIDDIVARYLQQLVDNERTAPVSISQIIETKQRELRNSMVAVGGRKPPTTNTELYFPRGVELEVPSRQQTIEWLEEIGTVNVMRSKGTVVDLPSAPGTRNTVAELKRSATEFADVPEVLPTLRGTQTPINQDLNTTVKVTDELVDIPPAVGDAKIKKTLVERPDVLDDGVSDGLTDIDAPTAGTTVEGEAAAKKPSVQDQRLEGEADTGFADEFENIDLREEPTPEQITQNYYDNIQGTDTASYGARTTQGSRVDTNLYQEQYDVEADLLDVMGATLSRVFGRKRSPEDYLADPFVGKFVDDVRLAINTTTAARNTVEARAAFSEFGVSIPSVRAKLARLRRGDISILQDPEMLKFVAISNELHTLQNFPDEWLKQHPGRDLPGSLATWDPIERRSQTTPGFAGGNRANSATRKNVGNAYSGGYKNGMFGNPYKASKDLTTEQSVAKYDEYIRARAAKDPEFSDAVRDLAGNNLVCPGAKSKHPGGICHAQPLARLADELAVQQPRVTKPKYKHAPDSPTYEVSTRGDEAFSALRAKMSDGRTIEDHYQIDFKGYSTRGDGKNSLPKPRKVGNDYIPDEATAKDMLAQADDYLAGRFPPKQLTQAEANEYAAALREVAGRRTSGSKPLVERTVEAVETDTDRILRQVKERKAIRDGAPDTSSVEFMSRAQLIAEASSLGSTGHSRMPQRDLINLVGDLRDGAAPPPTRAVDMVGTGAVDIPGANMDDVSFRRAANAASSYQLTTPDAIRNKLGQLGVDLSHLTDDELTAGMERVGKGAVSALVPQGNVAPIRGTVGPKAAPPRFVESETLRKEATEKVSSLKAKIEDTKSQVKDIDARIEKLTDEAAVLDKAEKEAGDVATVAEPAAPGPRLPGGVAEKPKGRTSADALDEAEKLKASKQSILDENKNLGTDLRLAERDVESPAFKTVTATADNPVDVADLGPKEWAALSDDAYVTVYHVTDEDTANSFVSDGVSSKNKPARKGEHVRHERFETGEGVYVGASPKTIDMYSIDNTQTTVAITVRKGDLGVPHEAAGYGTKGGKLKTGSSEQILGLLHADRIGALIEGDIPAGRVKIVGGAEPSTSVPDLTAMTVKELKAEARERGLRGFSKLNKDDLRARIEADAQPRLDVEVEAPKPQTIVEQVDASLTEVMWTKRQSDEAYTQLWRDWADDNPGKLQTLADRAQGRPLTDQFAHGSGVSQADALQRIMNERGITATQPVVTGGLPGGPSPLKKIISGGQTGADVGGLRAGRKLGLETGGTAPRGYVISGGFDPTLKDFGLAEHASDKYPPRTRQNVRDSDGTVIYAVKKNKRGRRGEDSPGSMLTAKAAREQGKPYIINPTPDELYDFVHSNGIGTLNIAGNREYLDEATIEATLRRAMDPAADMPPGPSESGWNMSPDDLFEATEIIQANLLAKHEKAMTALQMKNQALDVAAQKQETRVITDLIDSINGLKDIHDMQEIADTSAAIRTFVSDNGSELEHAVRTVWGPDATMMFVHDGNQGMPTFTVTFPGSDTVAIDRNGGFDHVLDMLNTKEISRAEAFEMDMPQVVKAFDVLEKLKDVKRNAPSIKAQAVADNSAEYFTKVATQVQSAIERRNAHKLRDIVLTRKSNGEYVMSNDFKNLLNDLSPYPAQQAFLMRFVEGGWLADAAWRNDEAYATWWQHERNFIGSMNMDPAVAKRDLDSVMKEISAFEGVNIAGPEIIHELEAVMGELLSAYSRVGDQFATPSPLIVPEGRAPFPNFKGSIEDPLPSKGFNATVSRGVDAQLSIAENVEIMKLRMTGILESDGYLSLRGADKIAEEADMDQWARHIADLESLMADQRLYQDTVSQGMMTAEQFGLGNGVTAGMVFDPIFGDFMSASVKGAKSVYTPYALSEIQRTMNKVMNWWKAAATVAKPSFHIRNIIGGISNGYIAGVHASDYKAVIKDVYQFRKALKKLEMGLLGSDSGLFKKKVIGAVSEKNREMFEQAWEHGVMQTSFTRAEQLYDPTKRMTWKPWEQNFAAFQLGGRTMESIEDVLRMATFNRWFNKGSNDMFGEAIKARGIVDAVHFDYTNLTDVERKIKTVMPFYVWTRRNIPLQMRVLTQNPSFLNWYNKMKSNWNEQQMEGMEDVDPFTRYNATQGLIMPYMRGNEDEWAQLIWSPQLPGYDLDSLPIFEGVGMLNPAAWMAFATGNMGPGISTLFSQTQAYEEGGSVNAPAGVNAVLSMLDALPVIDMFNTPDPTASMAPDSDYRISKGLAKMVDTMVPFYQDYRAMLGIIPNNPYRASGEGYLPSDDLSGVGALGTRAALGPGARVLGRGAGFSWSTPTGVYFSGVETEKELGRREIDQRLLAGDGAEKVGQSLTMGQLLGYDPRIPIP
jgi:hypothetical protein